MSGSSGNSDNQSGGMADHSPVSEISGASGNSDKQSEIHEKYEKLLEEHLTLKRRLSVTGNITRRCNLCGFRGEERGLRFCIDCCSKNGSVRVDQNNEEDLTFISFETVQLSLICATCCLEGLHKGHKTAAFQPFKRNAIAVKHLENFQKSSKNKCDSVLADGVTQLTNVLGGLEKTAAELAERAKLVKCDRDLDLLIGFEKGRETVLDEILSRFTENVEDAVREIKDLQSKFGEDWKQSPFSTPSRYLVRKTSDSVLTVSTKLTDVQGFVLCNVKNTSEDLHCQLFPDSLPRGCHVVTAQWRPHHYGHLSPGESVDLVVQLTLKLYNMGAMPLEVSYVTGKTAKDVKNRWYGPLGYDAVKQTITVPLHTSL